MFPDLIASTQDFEQQLGACIDSMRQDDACGETLAIERRDGSLHVRHILNPEDPAIDFDRYELVVFDGGTTAGDSWKHVFFPREREHYFVYDA